MKREILKRAWSREDGGRAPGAAMVGVNEVLYVCARHTCTRRVGELYGRRDVRS